MNDYASLRKQNKSRSLVVAVLVMCVILSSSLLFARLTAYTPEDTRQYIPLTQSNGVTRVTVLGGEEAAAVIPSGRLLVIQPMLLTRPGFQTYDKDTVWEGETQVEIFRVSYDNEHGEMTVHSSRGDKVLAPGTGSTYEFALENTGNVSLDYTLTMEAYFSHDEYPIPVDARVADYQGNYLAGSAADMADVLALNSVEQSGVISAGCVYPYTLEWEWPFESGSDAYDTMLGNLAVEEDITLTIVIKTVASCSDDPQSPGGIPETGDTSQVAFYAVLMVASLTGILLMLLLRRKEEVDEAH